MVVDSETTSTLPFACRIQQGILFIEKNIYAFTPVDDSDIINTLTGNLRHLKTQYLTKFKFRVVFNRLSLSNQLNNDRAVQKFIADELGVLIRGTFQEQCMSVNASSMIQEHLTRVHFKMDENSFQEEHKKRFYFLVNKIRQLAFMVRHRMPFERVRAPSNNKKRRSKHTWSNYLSEDEKRFLNDLKYKTTGNPMIKDYLGENHPLVCTQESLPLPPPTSPALCTTIRDKLGSEYKIFLERYDKHMYCHIRVDHLEKIQKEVIEFIIKKQARSFKVEGSNAFCRERSLSYPIRKSSRNNIVLKLDRKKIESFVGSLFFNNPIWDIELQKMYLFNSVTRYTRQETNSRIDGLPGINI